MDTSSSSLTAEVLEARCREYRDIFLDDDTATPEELDPYWPGGAQNPLTGQDGWIVAYGRCHWLLGRAIGHEEERTRGQRMGHAERDVLKLLTDEPERVTLVDRSEDGREQYLSVYPKSAMALEHIAAANLLCAWLCDQITILEQHAEGPLDLERLIEARAMRGYYERLICWIATTKGPQLPYPVEAVRPALPAYIEQLSPLDYYLLCEAFTRIHADRLRALDRMESRGERPDWPGLYVGAASELQVAVSRLWGEHSLGEIAATASEKVRLADEAKARAKDDTAGVGTLP